MNELNQAYAMLQRAGLQPTWAGDVIVANVPGLRLLSGGQSVVIHTPEVVRGLRAAIRLVNACS